MIAESSRGARAWVFLWVCLTACGFTFGACSLAEVTEVLPRAANGGAAGKADIEGGASSAGGQGGAAMGDGGGSATICNCKLR